MVCDYWIDDCFRDGGLFFHGQSGIPGPWGKYRLFSDQAIVVDRWMFLGDVDVTIDSL